MPSYSVASFIEKRQHFELDRLSSSLSSAFAQLSLNGSSSSPLNTWTLWRFDCRDFPKHCKMRTCEFCAEVNKLRSISENIVDEEQNRWDVYLKRERDFDDPQTLLKAVETDSFLPSALAKSVFFDHKLGVAIFRKDIPPKYESAENVAGGIFQFRLVASSGLHGAATVQKFDVLLTETLRLLFALPDRIGHHVHGVFYRCEVKRRLEDGEQPPSYANFLDLPFVAKLEVWIDNLAHKHLVKKSLVDQLTDLIEVMEIPNFKSIRFNPNNLRVQKLAKIAKQNSARD